MASRQRLWGTLLLRRESAAGTTSLTVRLAECRGGRRLPSTAHDRQEYPVSARHGWPQDLHFGACELAVAGSAFASRQHCYRGERGKARRLHRSGDSQAISPGPGLLQPRMHTRLPTIPPTNPMDPKYPSILHTRTASPTVPSAINSSQKAWHRIAAGSLPPLPGHRRRSRQEPRGEDVRSGPMR